MKNWFIMRPQHLSLILFGMLSAVFSISAAANSDIKTTVVAYSRVDVEQVFDGVVEPVEQTTLSAEITGRVTDLNVDIGDSVRKGAVLLRMDAAEQQARVAQEQAGRDEAAARLVSAREEYQRIKNLMERNLSAQSDLDRATAAFESAGAELKAAEARIKAVAEQMRRTAVTSPYDIVVTGRYVELGETVQIGQPLLVGISVDRFRVSVQVPQSLRERIRANNRAFLLLGNAPEQKVEASSIAIFPAADVQSHSYTVRVILNAISHQVLAGNMVKVAFVLGQERKLLLPRSTIAQRGEVTSVYVVATNGKISMRHIRTGRSHEADLVEVIAGLSEGESIALDPIKAGSILKQQASVHE